MNKRIAALVAAFLLVAAFGFSPVRRVAAQSLTPIFSAWIQNSLIDNTAIGSNTPSTGSFTELVTLGGNISGASLVRDGITLSSVDSSAIGATTPAPGIFTSLSASGGGTISETDLVSDAITLSSINSSAIGAVTPAAGAFTVLSATGGITGNLTGNVTGNVTGALNGSVGATTPSSGVFTTLALSNSTAAACAAFPSTSAQGCTVLVDGKIYEWGDATAASFVSSQASVTFPVTFNACFTFQSGQFQTSGTQTQEVMVIPTSGQLCTTTTGTLRENGATDVTWFAIGK